MFCAFEGPPQILRLYGSGVIHPYGSEGFANLLAAHCDNIAPPGARQIVEVRVELVQTSCGYGVPQVVYQADRNGLDRWAEQKGRAGIEDYWRDNNARSLDGLPTGLAGKQH